VLEAHLFTRDDGIVIDRFVARRYHTGDLVSGELWDRVRGDLEAVLDGRLDVSARVADRVRSYARPDKAPIPVEVRVAEESATRHTVVSVRCGDRIGRLAQIVIALRDSGCDVHYAKLDVRGRNVVDTFLVRRDGHPLRRAEDRAALAAEVTAALDA
jgi:[protein-PII] uridylyltransferase